ncbi:MAG: hypothetical protein BJ554DRAFT_3106, partial [Olpidium bornovanus]
AFEALANDRARCNGGYPSSDSDPEQTEAANYAWRNHAQRPVESTANNGGGYAAYGTYGVTTGGYGSYAHIQHQVNTPCAGRRDPLVGIIVKPLLPAPSALLAVGLRSTLPAMPASRDSSGSRRPCASPPPLATPHLGDTEEGCLAAEHRVDRRLSPATPPASTGPASSTLSAPVSAAHGGSVGCGGDACSGGSFGEEDLRPFPPSTGPSILTAVAPSSSDGTWAPFLRTQSPETGGDKRQSGPPSTASEDTPSDRCTKDGQGCDRLDPNDEDAEDYVSCCTGPPSPLCSLSPASIDKEAEGRSGGRSDDFEFDDFATYLDEDNFDGCDDAFVAFAAGGASISAEGETDRTRVFVSVSPFSAKVVLYESPFGLYSGAVNPSRVSRFVRAEAPSAADASDRICVGSVRSAGAGNEPPTPSYQIAGAAGFPPPSPTRSAASSQSGANAAAAALTWTSNTLSGSAAFRKVREWGQVCLSRFSWAGRDCADTKGADRSSFSRINET